MAPWPGTRSLINDYSDLRDGARCMVEHGGPVLGPVHPSQRGAEARAGEAA